jgi:hypothetical protein
VALLSPKAQACGKLRFRTVDLEAPMIELFFSYSHRDEDMRKELENHLAPLLREGVIAHWHDRRIVAGDKLDLAIDAHLETADIILLMVSSYFLASDYCNREVVRALRRHEAGSARLIPIILHPCDWQRTPLGGLLATPTDGKPVSKHTNPHDAFLDIVESIRRAAAEVEARLRESLRRAVNNRRVSLSESLPAPLPARPARRHELPSWWRQEFEEGTEFVDAADLLDEEPSQRERAPGDVSGWASVPPPKGPFRRPAD